MRRDEPSSIAVHQIHLDERVFIAHAGMAFFKLYYFLILLIYFLILCENWVEMSHRYFIICLGE